MLVMGKVAAAYGIKGWVKIQPFTEYQDSLGDYPQWFLGNEAVDTWRQVTVAQCKLHGKVLIARLDECPDRNAAERLRGELIAVPRSWLPEEDEDEFYWNDLIGLEVINLQQKSLGKVTSLLETGANDVLVVNGDAGQLLIPFVESVAGEVDLEQGMMLVDWQEDYGQ